MKPGSKILAAASLLLLLGLALFLLEGQGPPLEDVGQIDPSGAPSAAPGKGSPAASTIAARATVTVDDAEPSPAPSEKDAQEWVTLRSVYAVPLGPGRIKLAAAAGWDSIDASDAEGLQLPASDDTRVVRFQGYEQQTLPPGPGLFELAAESSLTFRSPAGSPSVKVWDFSLQEWALLGGAQASQLIGTGTQLVLISSLTADRRNRVKRPFVSFQIELASGWLVSGKWNPRPGEHHEFTLGVEQTKNLDTSDLLISARSPNPSQDTDEEWQWRLQTDKAPTSDLAPPQKPEVPWGTLFIEPSLGWSDFSRFRSTGNPATFEELFIGGTYLAAVHAQDWSEIGQRHIVFDGSPITIETESGWLTKAQLVDSRTRAPIDHTPVRLDMDFSSGDLSGGSFTWSGHVILTSDSEGALSTSLFTKVPVSTYYPWSPPTRVQLHIKVQGYEELAITATRDPSFRGVADLGRIGLVPLEPSFRFRLLSASQDTPNYVFLGTGPDSIQSMLETWPLREEEALFGARTSNNEADEDRLFLDRVQLAAARSEGLVLSDDHGHLHAISASNGIWQEVPSKDWSLPVHASETTESTGDLRIGYTWQGVDVPLGTFRDTVPTWDFRAPLEGVEIWVEDPTVEGPAFRRPPLKLADTVVLSL